MVSGVFSGMATALICCLIASCCGTEHSATTDSFIGALSSGKGFARGIVYFALGSSPAA